MWEFFYKSQWAKRFGRSSKIRVTRKHFSLDIHTVVAFNLIFYVKYGFNSKINDNTFVKKILVGWLSY